MDYYSFRGVEYTMDVPMRALAQSPMPSTVYLDPGNPSHAMFSRPHMNAGNPGLPARHLELQHQEELGLESTMPHRHQISSTTHTVEMAQIAEINDGVRKRESTQPIRASLLGMEGAKLSSGSDDDSSLPGDAFLVELSFDGPPEFPYVHAHFRTDPAGQGSLRVELHTEALRKLSQLLRLQHVWG